MLVLSRKLGETVEIDGGITVTVTRIGAGRVQLGIEAPQDVAIWRSEVPGEGDSDDHTN
ncbi:MAG: carbon storage regulator [Planctomycetota bacterium]|nr:MAG: carbon storage regulator [Planctomycetota bacterium]REJ97672.1 MAG: carbon storage regulator [Planctomycetota bacterium]REK23386.1 MAG: carbon storage regulator [Planctomycetota bacterium]REK48665.1 MAG: carbon storage regulator [Planctomycetota bacterium]